MPRYTAEEFKQAIKDYCDEPGIMVVYTKDGQIECQAMTFDAIAQSLGWSGRQGIYDQEQHGDDYKEAIEYMRGRMRTYWTGQGAVGNQGFATFMMNCLGEVPAQKLEVSSKVTDTGGHDW